MHHQITEPSPEDFHARPEGVCVYVHVGEHTPLVHFDSLDDPGGAGSASIAGASAAIPVAAAVLRRNRAQLEPLFAEVPKLRAARGENVLLHQFKLSGFTIRMLSDCLTPVVEIVNDSTGRAEERFTYERTSDPAAIAKLVRFAPGPFLTRLTAELFQLSPGVFESIAP